MKRRAFNLLAAVSLVMCAAMLVLWGTSYWRSTEIYAWTVNRNKGLVRVTELESSHGLILAYTMNWRPIHGLQSKDLEVGWHSGKPEIIWGYPNQFLGFAAGSTPNRYDAGATFYLIVPHWFVGVIALAFPLRQMLTIRSAQKNGYCRKCGYDLRASKACCPECGTAIPAPVGEAA